MNYRLHYELLVAKAKLRGLDKVKLDGYYETHHVLPRCLGGGDEPGNLVLLTAREHFVAHRLLCKMHPGCYCLWKAIACFMQNSSGGRSLTSKQFEQARLAQSQALLLLSKRGLHPWQTEQHRKAASERMRSYQNNKVAAGLHRWQTSEHAKSRSEAMKLLNAANNPGCKPENKAASSARMRVKYLCPCCGNTVQGASNARTYHFDKCLSNLANEGLTRQQIKAKFATAGAPSLVYLDLSSHLAN